MGEILANVEILTFSGGVKFVRKYSEEFCREMEGYIAGALATAGHGRPRGAA
jgi:hypothetical protein